MGTQPRRAPSPADRQVEVNAQVERATKALYEEIRRPWKWDGVTEWAKDDWRRHVRRVVEQGALSLPPLPAVDRPMEGQLTIDEPDPMSDVPFEDD